MSPKRAISQRELCPVGASATLHEQPPGSRTNVLRPASLPGLPPRPAELPAEPAVPALASVVLEPEEPPVAPVPARPSPAASAPPPSGGTVGRQIPPSQVPPVHGVRSAFGVPWQPPVLGLQLAFVRHSSQRTGVPGAQVVPWHLSLVVHGSPSSQSAPSFGVTVHPVAGSQPFCVQGFVSVQSSGMPATQRPA
jgi:hypothetical protein